jgi:RNA recognition motif-containing protein
MEPTNPPKSVPAPPQNAILQNLLANRVRPAVAADRLNMSDQSADQTPSPMILGSASTPQLPSPSPSPCGSDQSPQRGSLSDRVLYVTRLDPRATMADLAPLFEPFDEAVTVLIVEDAAHRSRGFGYINFSNPESAKSAKAQLRGVRGPYGKKLELQFAKVDRCSAAERTNKLFVRQVPQHTSGQQLQEIFAPFGTVTSVRILADRSAAGASERTMNQMAYVTMASEDEACIAMKRTHGKLTLPGGTQCIDVRLAESRNTRDVRRSSQNPTPSSQSTTPAPANHSANATPANHSATPVEHSQQQQQQQQPQPPAGFALSPPTAQPALGVTVIAAPHAMSAVPGAQPATMPPGAQPPMHVGAFGPPPPLQYPGVAMHPQVQQQLQPQLQPQMQHHIQPQMHMQPQMQPGLVGYPPAMMQPPPHGTAMMMPPPQQLQQMQHQAPGSVAPQWQTGGYAPAPQPVAYPPYTGY